MLQTNLLPLMPPIKVQELKCVLLDAEEVLSTKSDRAFVRVLWKTVKSPQSIIYDTIPLFYVGAWKAQMFVEAMLRSKDKLPNHFDEAVAKHFIGREALVRVKWEGERWTVVRYTHVRGY